MVAANILKRREEEEEATKAAVKQGFNYIFLIGCIKAGSKDNFEILSQICLVIDTGGLVIHKQVTHNDLKKQKQNRQGGKNRTTEKSCPCSNLKYHRQNLQRHNQLKR